MSASHSEPMGARGWEPNFFEKKFSKLMRLRRFIRANQKIGMNVEKSDYANGWKIKHTSSRWTVFTIYIDPFDGFSFFRAIPDIFKGIDCFDEHHLVTTTELIILRSVWCREWSLFLYGPPAPIKETWQGKLEQSFKEWPRQ